MRGDALSRVRVSADLVASTSRRSRSKAWDSAMLPRFVSARKRGMKVPKPPLQIDLSDDEDDNNMRSRGAGSRMLTLGGLLLVLAQARGGMQRNRLDVAASSPGRMLPKPGPVRRPLRSKSPQL